jgi:quercetin dioxygenase-like cupin family protein
MKAISLYAFSLLVPAGASLAQERPISPQQLQKFEIAGVPGKEVRFLRTTYRPGASNPKHYHTSYVTFYVLEGSGIWQEDGKEPVTLKPGDSLQARPGTVHSHSNASSTAPLVFLEFVIADKDQRSTVPMR